MYRVVIDDRAKSLAERPLDVIVAGLPVPTLAILGRRDSLFDCTMTAERYLAAGAQVAVVEEAVEWKADLIVIGTHGRRGASRLLLGSDAEQIVRCAPVPVLLVTTVCVPGHLLRGHPGVAERTTDHHGLADHGVKEQA